MSLEKKFESATDKALFLEEFFRYDLGRMLRVGGTHGNALKVIFGQSASQLRFFERNNPELFQEIFVELLSRFERVSKYRAPNGTWTMPKAEIEKLHEDLTDKKN